MGDFATFVLSQLPPAPARVLELGCGDRGGIVAELVARGYDAVGVDPRAPAGERFRRVSLDEWDEPGPWDAVVCGRVLHHVHPLAPALDRIASLAPLLLVDEFAWDRIDAAAQEWYEGQYRMLAAAGQEPEAPASLDEWRARHPDLHTETTLRSALDERWRELVFERRPYLHRWLRGPSSRALEESLVAAGAIPAIGWVYAGVARTETARTSADSR